MSQCFLCGLEISGQDIGKTNTPPITYNVICEECGAYKITELLILSKLSEEDKKAILWCLEEKADQIKDGHSVALINEDNIEYIKQEYREK